MELLDKYLERSLDHLRSSRTVSLRLELWNGRRIDLAPSPTVTISIPTRSALRYFLSPNLERLGEAFVEGHIRVHGSIHEVFRVGVELARHAAVSTSGILRFARHERNADRKAIEYHYDVSNDFYSLFLDAGMVYSCAYYRHDGDTLEAAQNLKLDHILRKLRLKPGDRLLDIGCGWGSLIMRAAAKYGVDATGITLSRSQCDYARERIRAGGLADRCRVELCDYRDLSSARPFDGISSVGMFEHVGLKNLNTYFRKIHGLLADGGLVLNHGITASDPDSRWVGMGAGEFIDRYVFPQGELPHASVVLREMASAGFEVTDVESLRRHYARTCLEWADRLQSNRSKAIEVAGEKRVRIWEIYLAGSAFGFARGWMNVYQVLACKSDAANPLPLTREYMYGPG